MVELDPWLNVKRNFYGVWQEYQGLGLTAGNAHAVEALRSLIFLFLKFLIPLNFIRYFYTYLCIFIGVFSMKKLLEKYIFPGQSKIFPLIGAIYYLFNLGTLQNFYTPFEAFSAYYAFLPLSFYLTFKFFDKEKNSLLLLILGFIFGTFAFQVPTLFIVHSALWGPIFLYLIIKNLYKKNFQKVNQVFHAGFLHVLINLFWFLPFAYFVISNISIRFSSISSRLSSDVSFFQNVRYANLWDIALMRGFWFSNLDYIPAIKTTGYMMQPWIDWMTHKPILILGYIIFGFIALGFLNYKSKMYGFMLYVLLISWFFLFNVNGPSGFLFDLLVKVVPILGEVFRFPFTKWIVPCAFAYSYFLATGSYLFYRLAHKGISYLNLVQERVVNIVFYGLGIILINLIIFFSAPMIRGELFYDYLRLDLPKNYPETFDYFKNEPKDRRIALLPINSFWGWQFNDWDYRGSGFMWFSIEQPILSRTFDVWHVNNEEFYHEFQYAMYSGNINLINYLIDKYQIGYFVQDTSIISPGAERSLLKDETRDILSKSNKVHLEKSFGKILVYKVIDKGIKNFLEAPPQYTSSNNDYNFSNIDSGFYGPKVPYVEMGNSSENIFSDDKNLSEQLNSETIKVEYPKSLEVGVVLNTGSISLNEPIPAQVNYTGRTLEINYIYPQVLDVDKKPVFHQDFHESVELEVDPKSQVLFGNKILQTSGIQDSFILDPENQIIVFDEGTKFEQNLGSSMISAPVDDCYGRLGDFGKFLTGISNSVRLNINEGSVCLNIPKAVTNYEPSLYEVSFEHRENVGSKILYCLYYEGSDTCINDKYATAPDKSQKLQAFKDYVYVEQPGEVKLKIILEAGELGKFKEALLKDPIIKRYNVSEHLRFSPDTHAYNTRGTVELKKEQFPLTIDLSPLKPFEQSYLPGSNLYNLDKQNCNLFNQKSFNRELIQTDTGPAYKYSAVDAISCDSLDLTSMDTRAAYQVSFKSQTISGRSLEICVAGAQFNKCMLEDKLDMPEMSFIIPPYSGAGDLYVNLENESIGDIETQNLLYGINVKYLPYSWMKSLSLSGPGSAAIYGNGIKIVDSQKFSPSKYQVEVEPIGETGSDAGLLILNQTFDKGWRLIDLSDCLFVRTMFTCSYRDTGHTKAKNWANSWVLPNKKGVYLLVYYPQILQFAGYLLFGLYVLGLIIYYKLDRKPSLPVRLQSTENPELPAY